MTVCIGAGNGVSDYVSQQELAAVKKDMQRQVDELHSQLHYWQTQPSTFSRVSPLTQVYTCIWTAHICSTWSTSVKIIKNEVGCRDDTVPKTVETRRHCEED